MAEDPKSPSAAPSGESPAGAAPSAPGAGAGAGAPAPSQTVPTEALSDGTTPTVLKTGQSHRAESTATESKSSLTSVYRRADILTTLLTFGGVAVAAALVIGGYYFFASKTAKPTPKVTTLDKSDLDKLGAFFQGNSAGGSDQVLTISSSALFQNRVALSSDLKVVGAAQITGPTTLGDLAVDKTATLGVTNVRGQLTVSGPLTVQNPALFNAGGSFKGNLTVSGAGSFGGALSAASITVADLSVGGALNVNGHLNIGGQQPAASAGGAAGSGASVTVSGNDTGGTATVTTGNVAPGGNLGGELIKITFKNAFPTVPTIVISPNSRSAARIQPYVTKTATWFIISGTTDASSTTTYSFDYWVVQ